MITRTIRNTPHSFTCPVSITRQHIRTRLRSPCLSPAEPSPVEPSPRGLRPPPRLSAAGLRALPAAELPAYPRLCLAVRLRQSATVRFWNTRAGHNPVAATEPHRHLQRRGLLHPDQYEGHLGADRDHRGDYADHHVD